MSEIDSKICSICNNDLPLDSFYYLKSKMAYMPKCKSCYSEHRKQITLKYRIKNKDEIAQKLSIYRKNNKSKRNIYYANNREKLKEANKRSYEKNRDVNIQKRKEWYLNNKEVHAAARLKYQTENKDKLKLARRKWENEKLRTDIDFRLQKKLRGRIRESTKGVYKKSQKTEELIGCDIQFFKNYIERQFSDGMTWENWSQFGWHIDHKIPLSWFNLANENCRKMAFHYTNMQPLWWEENLSKKNKFNHHIAV